VTVTTAATFCATLVDEWARAGVRHAVVAPGSRSTPLALALAADDRLALHVHHDERAAGYVALGIGLATGVPAVVLTTSGTAAVELHPAVAEAGLSGVPLVACTADRPPELHHVGAPQALDQAHLYGRAVRWYAEPGAPTDDAAGAWRSFASRLVVEARGGLAGRPGPVQANLAFREPLVGEPGPLPEGRPGGRPWHEVLPLDDPGAPPPAATVAALAGALDAPNGVVVAGEGAGDPAAVHALAEALGWPVLADPRSGCRVPARTTVAAFDAVLRHPGFARDHVPAAVLRLGAPPASKVLFQWLAASGARQVAIDGARRWWDPERTAALLAGGDPSALCRALAARVVAAGRPRTPWLARWARAEAAAQGVLARLDDPAERSEPAVARQVLAALPDDGVLVTSSSMPVRDVEWYGAPRPGGRVLANRGANGIDGVVSTGVGVALGTGAPTVVLIGDVAFLHDSTALLGIAGRDVDLTVVVVDNDGGGIFSFLPQATAVASERFEQLFGTPHGVDVVGLAALHGAAVHPDRHLREVVRAGGGVRVVRVRTDRAANVAAHDELHAAIAAAVGDVR
jgi:2-succinyl-5-enolpyruvyl-6-hydroxy-3-cyclohexene-1-carboxylate synthase